MTRSNQHLLWEPREESQYFKSKTRQNLLKYSNSLLFSAIISFAGESGGGGGGGGGGKLEGWGRMLLEGNEFIIGVLTCWIWTSWFDVIISLFYRRWSTKVICLKLVFTFILDEYFNYIQIKLGSPKIAHTHLCWFNKTFHWMVLSKQMW